MAISQYSKSLTQGTRETTDFPSNAIQVVISYLDTSILTLHENNKTFMIIKKKKTTVWQKLAEKDAHILLINLEGKLNFAVD
jgi:hypothetical protein